jgi:mannose-6-phosphate isomerase-like protein (cupin superfamily)
MGALGIRLTYQYKHKCTEAWTLLKGVGANTLDRLDKKYCKGEIELISQGVKHRIEIKEREKGVFYEVKTGS